MEFLISHNIYCRALKKKLQETVNLNLIRIKAIVLLSPSHEIKGIYCN